METSNHAVVYSRFFFNAEEYTGNPVNLHASHQRKEGRQEAQSFYSMSE